MPDSFSLRARWVLPINRPPIAGGAVRIVGDRIAEVLTSPGDGPCEDLGDVAVLPGLVNAHTHLEFSDCETPLPPGENFGDWIKALVAWRLQEGRDVAEVVQRGLHESTRAGTTTLGEIASPRWPDVFESPQLEVTAFVELLGLGAERKDENIARAQAHLRAAQAGDWHPAISPHAPYTVHPKLFAEAVSLAQEHDVPLAMHLAETREELKLLDDGGGPLRDMLEYFRAWEPWVLPREARPLDYLETLARCPRSLVIHGNYLDDEEVQFVAAHSDRMSVVYCPRTHEHFRHSPHPLEKLLAAGAQVAVGTDGRGSNPDLNLLSELRAIHRRHPCIAPATILELGTIGGALALGRSHEVGSLTTDKFADLAVVPLDAAASDPVAAMLESTAGVSATMYRGRWIE